MNISKFGLYFAAAAVLVVPASAGVGTGYTLLGNGTYVTPGNVSNQAIQLTSECPTGDCLTDGTNTYSGLDIAVPAGLTFAGIEQLGVDYKGTCGGGSPRFQINMEGASVFVYLGPAPGFTGCDPEAWTSTGNLVANTDARVDASQLSGLGGFYGMTYAQALAALGEKTVTGIQLIVDGGWFAPPVQSVLVDNLVFNEAAFDFEPASKDACKDGGWKNFIYSPGPFKNQGDCVSYFATKGKNQGSGK